MNAVMLVLIPLILSLLSFAPHYSGSASTGVDTMFAGQSLTGNETLVSRNGKFELGFFTPGNFQNYYIGLWFKQVAIVQKKKTIVWVANRDKPINATYFSSSEFKLLGNGHLVLLVSTKSNSSSTIPVWSTDSMTSKTTIDSSIKAVLGNDGNLVIMSSSNGNIMWQSFDHPTNAFLPGAKFGYNNLTKKDQKITSWRNIGDPSEGFYSIELEPDKSVISFKWNQSREFYNSGAWNGRFFSNFPEMRIGVVTSYDFTSYENRSFFTFSAPNEAAPIYVFIDLSGQLKAPIWQPKTQDWTIIWVKPMQPCKVYGICGAFSVCSDNNVGPSICQCLPGFEKYNPKDWDLLDYSGGCIRKTSLQCGDKDNFKKLPNMDVSRIIPSADALVVDDAKKCESACLKNCSCDAYAYYKNSSGNSQSFMCLLWYSNLLNIEQLGGDKGNDLFIRLAASEVLVGSKMKASTIWTIVGVYDEKKLEAIQEWVMIFSE
ncbi:hypothetical protein Scep_013243 [Stephania cephalantha]|uniref:Uncharacterized protein n=1 Tax=Stephania cephalantha TaxID=152367 RepID=A0AAP0JHI0_9MAGN